MDEALTLNQDTLTRYRRILDDDHPDTLRSASNLAIDLRKLGRVDEAEALERTSANIDDPRSPHQGRRPDSA